MNRNELTIKGDGAVCLYSCEECGDVLLVCQLCGNETEHPNPDSHRTPECLYTVNLNIIWNHESDGGEVTPDGERRILEIHTQLSSGIVEDSGECEYSGLWFRNGNLYVDVPAPIHPEPSLPTSECMGAKQQGRAKRTRNQGEV